MKHIIEKDFEYSNDKKDYEPINIFDYSHSEHIRFERMTQIQDSQFNHSKIVRHLENDLKHLMLDYNLSKIIQMSLSEKIGLLKQI